MLSHILKRSESYHTLCAFKYYSSFLRNNRNLIVHYYECSRGDLSYVKCLFIYYSIFFRNNNPLIVRNRGRSDLPYMPPKVMAAESEAKKMKMAAAITWPSSPSLMSERYCG